VNKNNAWDRAVILVDMDAFFASVEQLDNPSLRGKPVVVTNGNKGSCIITASYEARAYDIKTGMYLQEARQRCPQLIRCASRPLRYTEISRNIMLALEAITPDIEIFSIDEAFLDVSHCQSLHGEPITMAKMVRSAIWEACQLNCSVGVSGDKTTAKYAAKLGKPNGLIIIPPWEAQQALENAPVTALCGIGEGIGRFLNQRGVFTCGDIKKIPINVLSQRFGNLGRRIWYMCQGADPAPVKTSISAAKSMGHGKILAPNTYDKNTVKTYLQHMSEKLAARLRRHESAAQTFFAGFKNSQHEWLSNKYKLPYPSDDGKIIYHLAKKMLNTYWQGNTAVLQVQITALDPAPYMIQPDLFLSPDKRRGEINKTIDQINQRYGELMISPAKLLDRSEMPNVIGPCQKESF
jgi:DNA polymerase IV